MDYFVYGESLQQEKLSSNRASSFFLFCVLFGVIQTCSRLFVMDSELNKDDVEEKSVNEVASTSTAQSIPNESTKRRHEELEEDDDDEENAKEELRSYREAKALLGAADEENCSFSKVFEYCFVFVSIICSPYRVMQSDRHYMLAILVR